MKKIKNIGNSMLQRPIQFFKGVAFIAYGVVVNTTADLLKNQPEA